MISSKFPNEKAALIATFLREHYLISNNMMYEVSKNITFKMVKSEIKMKLLKVTTFLIQESYKNLTTKEKAALDDLYDARKIDAIFTNSSVLDYYPQLFSELENNDVAFDHYLCEIHFLNGYIDLYTLEFKHRVLHENYVTEVIKRDYIQSTEDQQIEVLTHIKKIYPHQGDLDNILLILGSCLSGKANVDQDTLFLLGKGSSGKSFTLELTKQSIEIYLKELKDDTFSNNNAKSDKILNTFNKSPHIRISWINEMKDTKIDDSLFKAFCDGKAQTTKLYEDGSNSIELKSKAIITANNMPNIKIDTGTTRRILSYTHKSSFIDNPKDVDETKHIYLKDKNLIEKLTNQLLLTAWFDILASYCQKWLHGAKLKYSKNFEETKQDVTGSNDIFQDFLDSKVKITNSSDDRVGKNEMAKAFTLMYPNKCLTVQQIINSLKEKGLAYEGTLRCKSDGIKGCYMGVKLEDACKNSYKDDHEDDDDSDDQEVKASPLDYGIKIATDYKALYEQALRRIKELEAGSKII